MPLCMYLSNKWKIGVIEQVHSSRFRKSKGSNRNTNQKRNRMTEAVLCLYVGGQLGNKNTTQSQDVDV